LGVRGGLLIPVRMWSFAQVWTAEDKALIGSLGGESASEDPTIKGWAWAEISVQGGRSTESNDSGRKKKGFDSCSLVG